MAVNINQFDELREQIVNQEKWDNKHFHVFNYEAGTGKSISTHQFIGEMTKEHPFRVLYVQRFVRDNELDHTVNAINKHAGRTVAFGYSSKNSEGKRTKVEMAQIVKSQVLCITHNMYGQICKGKHKELIHERDILIIDEYPDLLEKISILPIDIGILWMEAIQYPEIEEIAILLRKIVKGQDGKKLKKNKMVFYSFESPEYEKQKKGISNVLARMSGRSLEVLQKCQQLLINGGYLFEGAFHTYVNNDFQFCRNNIILDANAEFDYRYEMSDKFIVRNQAKVFEYSKSTFIHYDVNTTKKALAKYVNFSDKVLEDIDFEKRKGILFITDKDNQKEIENSILQNFSHIGESMEEIERVLGCKISVDYYGNIIGVNSYREYDTVVIAKTPHYDYLTYALTYLYYYSSDQQAIEYIDVFKHPEVEAIRKSVVAGEIYQAIKRINRANHFCANIYVFSDYQEAIDVVLQQLPKIPNTKTAFDIEMRRKQYDGESRHENSMATKVQEMLIKVMKDGRESITKKELREILGIEDKFYFSKILTKLKPFLEQHKIQSVVQKLIFTLNSLGEDYGHGKNKDKSA